MKYRRLTKEELEPLEKEFVDFLVVNGIVAEDWVKIKENEPDKADSIIDSFSDVILEGVLRQVKFIDYLDARTMYSFQCNENDMHLISVSNETEAFDTKNPLDSLIKNISKSQISSQHKKYKKDRGVEIFDLLQNGAQISDGALFKRLALLYAQTQE